MSVQVKTKFNAILNVLLSILFILILTKTLTPGVAYMIKIPLVYRMLPIPVFAWIAILAYTATYAFINKKLLNESWPGILLLGFASHMWVLMIDLIRLISSGTPIARVYILYIWCYIFLVTTAIFVWGAYIIFSAVSEARRPLPRVFDFYFMPVPVLVAYALVSFILLRLYFFTSAVILSSLLIFYLGFNEKAGRLISKCMGIFKNIIGRELIYILMLFLFAFSLRMLTGLHMLQVLGDNFILTSDDGETYHRLGSIIANAPSSLFHGIKITPKGFDPGCSIFWGIFYRIFGFGFFKVILFQNLLNAIAGVVLYFTVKNLTKNRIIAVISFILFALSQALIYISTVIATESLAIPLLILLTLGFFKYADRKADSDNYWLLFFLGVIFAVMSVIKAMMFSCFLLILLWAFFAIRKPLARRMKDIALFAAVVYITLLPMAYANYLNTGGFYMISESKAKEAWVLPTLTPYSPGNEELVEMGIAPFQDLAGSLRAIIRHPFKFTKVESRLLFIRVKNYFGWYNWGYVDPVFLVNSAYIKNTYSEGLELYSYIVFFIGLYYLARHAERKKLSFIFLIISYFVFVHAVLFRMGTIRFRAIIDPYLLSIAAAGLFIVLSRMKILLGRGNR